MSFATEARIKEIVQYYKTYGEQETQKFFGLKPDSLRRYLRRASELGMDLEGKTIEVGNKNGSIIVPIKP